MTMSKEQQTPEQSPAAVAAATDDAGTKPRRSTRAPATPTVAKTAVQNPATRPGRRRTAAADNPPPPAAALAIEAADASDSAPPVPSAPVEKLVRKALAIKEARPRKAGAKKARLVRDSFTFPESDYALFATLKQRALAAGGEIKKSELVRAGLALLNGLDDADLARVLGKVERIKTGRPKKK